jgi:hypothetical protein
VIALFRSVLNRGIVAGRMVASALFNIEHNLPPRFYHRCGTGLLAFRGSLINHRLFLGRRRAKGSLGLNAGFFWRWGLGAFLVWRSLAV